MIQTTVIPSPNGTPLVSDDGGARNFVIPSPQGGEVLHARVMQISGSNEGFSFAFYESEYAASPDTHDLAEDADLYCAVPEHVIPSGETGSELKTDSRGLAFANRDGDISTRKNQLYLRIVPNTAVAELKEFGVRIAYEVDDAP